ncbi:MAG: FAD:protein FMN transferase [Bacteroidota bacterium]
MKTPTILLLVLILFSSCEEKAKENIKLSGPVFGSCYEVAYYSETNEDFQKAFDSLFNVINLSLSTYRDDSDISMLNRNEPVKVDDHFKEVFNRSKEIHKFTNGVFDPTIGAVVNAWDFGPKGKVIGLDSAKIDSLMLSVGLDKVALEGNSIIKQNEDTFIDFNAIAKGYGVDVVADFLESKGITSYIVEIGGEIRAKGINIEKDRPWTVGVEKPNFDGSRSIMRTLQVSDIGMATSGTYRKFSVDVDGNRYSHIINPKTGYPSKTNVLSVSVLASDCMTADAYATAFQAMGIERVTEFLKSHPELKVYLIFENESNNLETLTLNGFPEN